MQHSFGSVGLLPEVLSQPFHVLWRHLFWRHIGEVFRHNGAVDDVIAKFRILDVTKVEDARADDAPVFLTGVAFGWLERGKEKYSLNTVDYLQCLCDYDLSFTQNLRQLQRPYFLGKNCVCLCVCVSLSSHLEDSLLDPGGYVLGDLHRRRIFSPFDESIEKQLPTLQPQVVRRRSLSNEFVRSFSAGIKWKVDNTWVMLELPLNQIKLWNWNMVKTIPQKLRVILLFLSDDTFQNRTFAALQRQSYLCGATATFFFAKFSLSTWSNKSAFHLAIKSAQDFWSTSSATKRAKTWFSCCCKSQN